MTTKEFYEKLKEDVGELGEVKTEKDTEIQLLDEQIEMLRALFAEWVKRMSIQELKKYLNDFLKKPTQENGKVYELLVYAWLERNVPCYVPQIHIEREKCFKASENGYDADGRIEETIVFDVKQFGITLPHIATLQKKLQEKIPEEYWLSIEGDESLSNAEFQKRYLNCVDDLAAKIMNEGNSLLGDYLYRDKVTGWSFRLRKKEKNPVNVSVRTYDAYQWAENNEFYFMNHASQFCVDVPYIIFCPYDKDILAMLCGDREIAMTSFRALCRRMFMRLTRIEDHTIDQWDGKARSGITVAQAAKKLSAMVFLDVSENFDGKVGHAFMFKNPNADHPVPEHSTDAIFRAASVLIDDFRCDNY